MPAAEYHSMPTWRTSRRLRAVLAPSEDPSSNIASQGVQPANAEHHREPTATNRAGHHFGSGPAAPRSARRNTPSA